MSSFRPPASGGSGPVSVDLTPVLSAIESKASQASVDALNTGAFPGEVRTFVGAVPAGFEQVGGPAPSAPTGVRFARWPAPVSGHTRAAFAVAGGRLFVYSADSAVVAFREWDAATGDWVSRANQGFSSGTWSGARVGALVGLQDGRLLLTAAGTSTASAQAFAYSPATDTWASVANLPSAQRGGNGVLLADGRAMVLAGSSVLIYNPALNVWTAKASAPAEVNVSNGAAGLAVLPSGKVLALTGSAFAVYDPVADTWTAAGVAPFGAGVGPGLISTLTGALCLSNSAAGAAAWAPMYEYREESSAWLVTYERTPLVGGSATAAYSPANYSGLFFIDPATNVYVADSYLPRGVVLGRKT